METKTMAVADAIEAQLNYLVPTDETPYSYTYDPPPGVPARSGGSPRRAEPGCPSMDPRPRCSADTARTGTRGLSAV